MPKKSKSSKKSKDERIPAKVGARSKDGRVLVVLDKELKSFLQRPKPKPRRRRKTQAEIAQDRVKQAKAVLGIAEGENISLFGRGSASARRPTTTSVKQPVGGFTGLTEGYGITQNTDQKLDTKFRELEVKILNQISQQNSSVRQNENNALQDEPRRSSAEILSDFRQQQLKEQEKQRQEEEKQRNIQQRQRILRESERRGRQRNRNYRQNFTPLPTTDKDLEREKQQREASAIKIQSQVRGGQSRTEQLSQRILQNIQKEDEEKARVKSISQNIIGDLINQSVEKSEGQKRLEETKRRSQARIRRIDFEVGEKQAREREKEKQKETEDFLKEEQIAQRQIREEEGKEEEVRPPTGLLQQLDPSAIVSDFEARNRQRSAFGDEARQQQQLGEILETQEDIEQTTQQLQQQLQQEEEEEEEDEQQFTDVVPVEIPTQPQTLQPDEEEQDISIPLTPQQQPALNQIRQPPPSSNRQRNQLNINLRNSVNQLRSMIQTPPVSERFTSADASGLVSGAIDSAFETATRRATEREEAEQKRRREERAAIDIQSKIRGQQVRTEADRQRELKEQQDRQKRAEQSRRNRTSRSRSEATSIASEALDDLLKSQQLGREIVRVESSRTGTRASGQGRASKTTQDYQTEYTGYTGDRLPQEIVDSNNEKLRLQEETRRITEQLYNNLGLNGRFIPFNARDLNKITSQTYDKAQLRQLEFDLRRDNREEVKDVKDTIIKLVNRVIQNKGKIKTEQNKVDSVMRDARRFSRQSGL